MKIALAQINPIIGDIAGNLRQMKSLYNRARRLRVDLVIFPELAITGYPPRDLIEQSGFIEQNITALNVLRKATTSATAIVTGFIDRTRVKTGKPLANAVALLQAGQLKAVRHKTLLPTYDVFDETRHFSPALNNKPVLFKGHRLALTICEDMWNQAAYWPKRLYVKDPIRDLAKQGAELFINISASPFHGGKPSERLAMMVSHVRSIHKPFIFVNQVGGNDELIFDGSSLVLGRNGNLLAQAASFKEDFVVVDLKKPSELFWKQRTFNAEIHDALVLGIRDYTRKCGFEKVLIGLSGGIDSAVTAALAVEALGSKNVLGLLMPSPYSSKGSVTDAVSLCRHLKIDYQKIPITSVYQTFLSSLKPSFQKRKTDVAEENIQARIRGTLLMALSNKFNRLLLTTGNKSELSMGYCTLYGDMNGGLAVLSDLPKTIVYEIASYINRNGEVIPNNSITKAPSAELRPNQTDQDSLPPYPLLDRIIQAYVEEGRDPSDIQAGNLDRATIRRIVQSIDRNEYKRRQAAPGLRVMPKAFGMGRRMPIARGDFRKAF